MSTIKSASKLLGLIA